MIIDNSENLKKKILESLVKDGRAILLTHKNPDGDGFAACLALKRILTNFGYEIEIILERQAPDVYDYISGAQSSREYSEKEHCSTVIILDCHETKRLGECAFLLDHSRNVIAIDHHPLAEEIRNSAVYIDTSIVSTGAIIFQMFSQEIANFSEIDKKYIAECIYTTILNDTDNFMNKNTDSYSFAVCSGLSAFGLDPGYVAEKFLYDKTASEMRFTGEVLSTIITYDNDTVLFIDSTLEMLSANHLGSEATSKLTRWLKGTRSVKVIVYFREIDTNKYRLSLRSNFMDVNRIAKIFGGGGHIKASGCEMSGSLAEIQAKILRLIRDGLSGRDNAKY